MIPIKSTIATEDGYYSRTNNLTAAPSWRSHGSTTNNIISLIQQDDKDMTTSSNISKEGSAAIHREIVETAKNKNTELEQKNVKNHNPFLSIDVIKKMLTEILSKTRLSKEELATKLQISTEDLISLMKGKSEHLIPKINLPLIKIYCKINSQ